MILDDEILKQAQEATKIKSKTELVHAGLKLLIQREAAFRLAALGGSDKNASAPPRKRAWS